MTPDQIRMVNAALAEFLSHFPNHRYTTTEYPDRKDVIFALQERLPSGEKGPDGSRFRLIGQITHAQRAIIAQTSQSQEEMTQRIHRLIVDGVDTTRAMEHPVQTGGDLFTLDQVKDIVKQALAESRKMLETPPKDRPPEPRDPVEAALSKKGEDAPSGVQSKPRKSVKQYQKDKNQKLKLWTDRAELMGMGKPILRERDGHIDGRWIRRAERAWKEYTKAQTVS